MILARQTQRLVVGRFLSFVMQKYLGLRYNRAGGPGGSLSSGVLDLVDADFETAFGEGGVVPEKGSVRTS